MSVNSCPTIDFDEPETLLVASDWLEENPDRETSWTASELRSISPILTHFHSEGELRKMLPANWDRTDDYEYFLSYAANREYARERTYGVLRSEESPVWEIQSDNSGDGWGYAIYEDGSLLFWNNAQDETWTDWEYYVSDQLMETLRQTMPGCQERTGLEGTDLLDAATLELLRKFFDSDEEICDAMGIEYPEVDA